MDPQVDQPDNTGHMPKAMLWLIIVAIIMIGVVVFLTFWMNNDDSVAPSVTINTSTANEATDVVQEQANDDFEGWQTKTATYKYGNTSIDFTIRIPGAWSSDNGVTGFAAVDKGTTNGFNGTTCMLKTRWDHGLEDFSNTGTRNLDYKSFNQVANTRINSKGTEWTQVNVSGIVFEVWAFENQQNCYDTVAQALWSMEPNNYQSFSGEGFSLNYPSGWYSNATSGPSFSELAGFNPDGVSHVDYKVLVGILSVDKQSYIDGLASSNLVLQSRDDNFTVSSQKVVKLVYKNITSNRLTTYYVFDSAGKVTVVVGEDPEINPFADALSVHP